MSLVASDDDRGNDAGAAVGHDVVAVNLTPFIACARPLKVTGAIVDLLTAVPVVVIHVVAALPFLVLNVVLLDMIVPVVVLLGHERSAANAEEEKCGESFLEQVIDLRVVGWARELCCCTGDVTITEWPGKERWRISR